MKRDMDLVRQILLHATSQDKGYADGNPVISGYTEDQIGHHVHLMQQADLVEAANTSTMGEPSPTAMLISVKWKGHDFVEAARSDKVWTSALDKVKAAGGSITFDLLKDLLVSIASKHLGLS